MSVNRQLLSKVSVMRNTELNPQPAVPIIIEIRSKEGNLKFPGRNYIYHGFYFLVTVFINVQIDFIKCTSYHKI